jgi:HAMP domain-containing protein
MMLGLLLSMICAADPVTEAGVAYRQALDALGSEKYEEAVQLLRGALQKLGEESDSLKYRDGIARRRHAYYPYYEWARARLLQAKQETSIFTRRDLLKEALSRLSQTRHPDAALRIEEAKQQLAVVEKAIELDGSFASAKTRIEVLGTGERFEEALAQLDAMMASYLTRDKELGDLRASLKERQLALEKRYEGVLAQRLGDVTLADPVTAGDSIAEILKPAKIPVVAVAKPGAPFVWLARFLALWREEPRHDPPLTELTAEEVNALAGSFETVALEAIDSGVPAGFRASRHVAHAIRMSRLNRIATGAEDVIDTTTAANLAKGSKETSVRAGSAVAKLPASLPIRSRSRTTSPRARSNSRISRRRSSTSRRSGRA